MDANGATTFLATYTPAMSCPKQIKTLLSFLILTGSLFGGLTQAKAVAVSILPSSNFQNGQAVINIGAPAGTLCDVAVGSAPASPDYKWFEHTPCTTVTVHNLPDVSKIYVRVFAGGPGQDFIIAKNSAQKISSASVAPTILAPTKGQKVIGPTTVLSWTNQNADSYDIIVGSALNKSNYGSYATKDTSLTLKNLPQNGKTMYVRVRAHWGKKVLGRTASFVSVVIPPVIPPAPLFIAPILEPAPTLAPVANDTPVVVTPVVESPTPAPVSVPLTVTSAGHLSAVWAQEGGDKVAQEELRAAANSVSTQNSVWNGSTVSLFGGKNEVVNFNLVLEAAQAQAGPLSVSFDSLVGPNGYTIKSKSASGSGLYDWTGRNIELFFVRYLEIKGLSAFTAGNYDESQWPSRWQADSRLWANRPDHNKHYPDIAVPYELHDNFTIAAGRNQSIWADVYIPKDAPAGTYTGVVTIKENGAVIKNVPVQLVVRNFALPDTASAKTMLYLGYPDINNRYFGNKYPAASEAASVNAIRDHHFELAHRHKISLVDANDGVTAWNADAPRPEWAARLNGQLFTAANGYDGPGVGVGNGIFSIGSYGSWNWKDQGKAGMWTHSDNWVKWFDANAPLASYFLYLIDESSDYASINQWASWLNTNPGPGNRLPSMATLGISDASVNTKELDLPASTMTVGATDVWQVAANYYTVTPGKKYMMYNGGRPGSGSFMMEDDGVALRELAWGQYKKNIDRWFYWESTYYNNYQGWSGETNVFKQAKTFGSSDGANAMRGEIGWNYSNGDGVLFYPGTDKVYPGESYNVPGPFASLRLKFWRRGIQDVDYLTLAAKINPAKTQQIVNSIVPKVLWENGVDSLADPTYRNGSVSWSNDPNVWEGARAQLADIIENN